jgi:hypothetical protein
MNRFLSGLAALALGTVGMATIASPARAASHSDAPLIKLDPQANITDVYAFVRNRTVGDSTTKVLNVLVNVRPFANSGDGVMYEKFSDDARYSIHITDPNTGETLVRYDFFFSGPSAGLKNQGTILSYGLGTEVGPILNNDSARRNYTQTYTVTKTVGNGTPVVVASNLLTPPPNVGNTTPLYNLNGGAGFADSGKNSRATLDVYTREAIYDLPTGETLFAGARDDSFYADTAGIFDLLNSRILDNDGNLGNNGGLGQDGNGVDDFDGFNVLNFSIQIPVSDLPNRPYRPVLAGLGVGQVDGRNIALGGDTTGVGVYASVSRPRVTLRSSSGAPTSSGPWVQVNRMGNPLFNEVLVALRDKDNYNRTNPTGDAAFATYAQNPEVAALINVVYGTTLRTTGRADLAGIYIPDVLRVDTTTDPVPVPGEAAFRRLGVYGLDAVNSPNGLREAGWPNGRRHGEDVVDIALTTLSTPDNSFGLPNANNLPVFTLIGDNVAGNDLPFHTVFPYVATPHSGFKHNYGKP